MEHIAPKRSRPKAPAVEVRYVSKGPLLRVRALLSRGAGPSEIESLCYGNSFSPERMLSMSNLEFAESSTVAMK
jgi:hypothetical protein